MTKIYKLTDASMRTYGGYQWTLGEKRTTSGEGGLCGPGWLHGCSDPNIAVIMNPIHGTFAPSTMRMFEGEADGKVLDDHGLKCGCTEMTLAREIDVPVISMEHRIAFGILCASKACKDPAWTVWAEHWLSGEDRSKAAAWAAANAADLDLAVIFEEARQYVEGTRK